jgi:membrane-associated phospholipid phosphatase
VLFYNPKSGGGKAMRLALAQAAGQQGIEAVELQPGASIVAFSRVYTGVHYPSDVLVGATVGALLGRVVAATVARHTRGAPGPAATA